MPDIAGTPGGRGPTSDWPGVRLHVVTGKGGTGKTTVAAALALALASLGRRVLLAEVEGRQGFSQALDVPPLPCTERLMLKVSGGGEMWGLAVDAKAALVEYLELFYHLGRAGRALEKVGAIDFATTIAPGVRDVLLIGKVYEAARRRADRPLPDGSPDWHYDAVVLDAPPTGRVGRFLGVNQEVADLAKVGPIRSQADSITKLLRSGSCAVHLVTLLEEMPVQEAVDAVAELRAAGLPLGAVVVNQARDPLLAPQELAQLSEGRVDREALSRVLSASSAWPGPLPGESVDGVEGWSAGSMEALVAQGVAHADRMRLENEQFAVVESLGRPVYVLPPLREGMDATGIRVLAQELADQASW
ncbi:ArsA-related P-loop ATPase [Austwickia chelonae]|uniref:ArsA-related P-loop ATPase n=1 Tax=Austwickia chelonae TaxID=100225 RepID=UPI00069092DD|nr:ArsA-related P-loop ATPase [Austwickia chelonae]